MLVGVVGGLAVAAMLVLGPTTTRSTGRATGAVVGASVASGNAPAYISDAKHSDHGRTVSEVGSGSGGDEITWSAASIRRHAGQCAAREEWTTARCTWGTPGHQRVLAVGMINSTEGLGNAILETVG